MDIHKKSWQFHFTTDIVSRSGHTFPPDVEKIRDYVKKNYPGYEVSLANRNTRGNGYGEVADKIKKISFVQEIYVLCWIHYKYAPKRETIYHGGSTPRANRHERNMIIEASWIAIRIDPVMQNYYRSHAGKNSKAVIRK